MKLIRTISNLVTESKRIYEEACEKGVNEKELDRLNDANLNAELRQSYINTMYKKSLENEYYDSLEELLTLE